MQKLIIFWLATFFSAQLYANDLEHSETLTKKLEEVRKKSGVQGIAVSIIDGTKPPVFLTTGYANIENRVPISNKTQFRFGSVSKILVAMSVMKLVEDGQISLQDPIKNLVPEIFFDNPFSPEYPLRVQHLLNHSAGWDAMRFAENAPQQSSPISIKKALELQPASRISRWPPGSRIAYNNTGYLVAAYIVKKITGMSYEAFVKQVFFAPLGMQSSDYFYTDDYRENQATLYVGKKPLAFEKVNNRPAGALNSNIKDITKLLQFLINQGASLEHSPIGKESFVQMQTPAGSLPTSAGLEVTHLYGLQQFNANGYVLYGHEGSVQGGSALLAYQPQLKKGYVIAVNGKGPAIPHIHLLLANMITKPNAIDLTSSANTFSKEQLALSGFYKNISPLASLTAPFSWLIPWKLHVQQNVATIGPFVGGKPRQLFSGENQQFLQSATGQVVLIETHDPIAGSTIQYGSTSLQKVSFVSAYLPLLVIVSWIIGVFTSLAFSLWWLPGHWLGKNSNTQKTYLRSWPLITFTPLLITLAAFLVAKSSSDIFSLLGQPSWFSLTVFSSSILFFVSSLWSLNVWWKTSGLQSKGFVYWHSSTMIFLNLTVAIYLLLNGLIGIRLWT